MMTKKRPLALLILDGWGYSENTQDNAVFHAKTPVLDKLNAQYAHSLISGSGIDVGLPDGQMGNSEVGHINIGSGRIVYQELTRISKAIADHEFEQNPALSNAVDKAIAANGAVHIMGLLSAGGVHSHEEHIEAMCRMAIERGATKVYLHAFLDGRDTPPRSAKNSLVHFDELFAELGHGRTASLIGRYFAMDRDNRWDRVSQAYELITEGKGKFTYASAPEALEAAYARDENDEFVAASVIVDAQGEAAELNDNDALIFMNFRADRARQITRTFVNPDFDGFVRNKTPKINFVMLTDYAADIKAPVAYPSSDLVNTLGETLQNLHKTQLRISETEKYAHVTFFFNGGKEEPFEGEDRILIESPKVATYDLQPEMSSTELTDKLVAAIESNKYDVVICNYPNGDMVGHSGKFDAAVKACEAVDACIGRVVEALAKVDGECLITADHGNAEKMTDLSNGQAFTAHTSNLVPFVYVGRDAVIKDGGRLSDIAPTMLTLMGQSIPKEMSGRCIIDLKE
ncbi:MULTISPECIES: 2,3-bisphosphoglycerate-independent phosphoglycerate mutase [Shewanella]|uniref:2,3-bisphosphoglycerate-independent phosphoglycerate mutase n=1 Tax=Shewanella vesiculosa TaxID=518738 RepID=A0ABV0FUN3_9GAMM|nr:MULTISPECIES: 2,3-bisphosphoglycerate-independent phosphoglycerate mutase [Shewanella]NCQ45707.1 2,3-bisphosphoglycerate-independent phosphoglycerate mutase [Shewanella frigidimarina]MBB1322444.1 2,3-bisphosphoglycerate-independent phosphoglycerate mutase [Shewanella sp. SR43-8]MBB1390410.1 2,3-bisphosphoglycerate-independent phosphoglycerate mutase [Shewanella sp. SG44-6]NCO72378.1 2,3-bisphosphoglycerate-independent phosphoglycerate mutase [Shewanella vesiculosa]NCP36072.1 2,3-bisphosphog